MFQISDGHSNFTVTCLIITEIKLRKRGDRPFRWTVLVKLYCSNVFLSIKMYNLNMTVQKREIRYYKIKERSLNQF